MQASKEIMHGMWCSTMRIKQAAKLTVHCVSFSSVSLSCIMVCVSFTISCSRSGMPSPVMALVGTTLT